MNSKINAFELLCKLASERNWCWKVPCSTCGNYDFRYGFLQLADGRKPYNSDWMSTRNIEKNKIYEFPREYSYETKQAVLNICLNSNLEVIQKECSSPDWLAYLGVVLSHMAPKYNEKKDLYNELSKYWGLQLGNMIPKASYLHRKLQNGVEFVDLESCEKVLGKIREEQILYEESKKYNENIVYESLVDIINNTGHSSSYSIALYAKQEDIDKLSNEEYEKLCKMYAHLPNDSDNPWAKFKEKFLNGR